MFTSSILFLIIISISIINGQHKPKQKIPEIDPNHFQPSLIPCYQNNNKNFPQKCFPHFINVVYNLNFEVTNTCGIYSPTNFCMQTGQRSNKYCDVCDINIPQKAHLPKYLTDSENSTFWQSETMAEGIKYPQTINLTINLNKQFEITYVHLKFISPRPESFVIYKKNKNNGNEWIPWQYYSGSCLSTFKLPEKAPILPGNEATAQCTKEFSDISPLTGGRIAFSTLEGRPSAENFEESEELQDWVTADQIRISLVRMNTFGDEIFGNKKVLSSYYYGISDLAVGGRCKCNGHANECIKSTGKGLPQKLICKCQHNTRGIDCNECAPFYFDRPWRPATSFEANECLPCNCSGLSKKCFFDPKLFEETGHGGHCYECLGNTEGVNCERCLPKHWRSPNNNYCKPCNCNINGSLNNGKCNENNGICECKNGVTGKYCDKCLDGYFGFGINGCKKCLCNNYSNSSICSPLNGKCFCKENVEGEYCDRCKPGYFLIKNNKNNFECFPCFCFGHSSICYSNNNQQNFIKFNISSNFKLNNDDWKALSIESNGEIKNLKVNYDYKNKLIFIKQECPWKIYFVAPTKFLGDQRFSYGQYLYFSYHKLLEYAPRTSTELQLIGSKGDILSLSFSSQQNPNISTNKTFYKFKIHSNPKYQWNPHLNETDFIKILTNLTSIRIRATFFQGDIGYLSDFGLNSVLDVSDSKYSPSVIPHSSSANWIENCNCPPSYSGQFCQFCAPGFKREFPGPLSKCIPCQCNGHSFGGKMCEPETGICYCKHNTSGNTCERCANGFFGDALIGTSEDCQPCNCPGGGACIYLDKQLICTECPEGYTGPRCEYCSEDYFGHSLFGKPCQKCDCNGNIDPNNIRQCNLFTGQCLQCIHHTTGRNCEKCLPGFWKAPNNYLFGDNNENNKNKFNCIPCNCHQLGTIKNKNGKLFSCSQINGQCKCLPNVTGKRCEKCAIGYFNIFSKNGCQPCNCDPLGSLDVTECNQRSGQCKCKNGVIGINCDQCAPQYFGLNSSGCTKCLCNKIGSESIDFCDIRNGQCLCNNNVEGIYCDHCKENYFNLSINGCQKCDDCYSLISSKRDFIKEEMFKFKQKMDNLLKIKSCLLQ
uniref:Uncharacterized protein n=1 Tax=Meloidogyne incognita TaxID=6306 RepID=A0A914N519_MELIC